MSSVVRVPFVVVDCLMRRSVWAFFAFAVGVRAFVCVRVGSLTRWQRKSPCSLHVLTT